MFPLQVFAVPYCRESRGEKPLWVDHYRRLDKVRRFFDGGRALPLRCQVLMFVGFCGILPPAELGLVFLVFLRLGEIWNWDPVAL